MQLFEENSTYSFEDSNNILPILSLGYNIIQLQGIDNKQLSKDIIENKHISLDINYEETVLPDTVESKKLRNMVHDEIMKINKYFKPYDWWAHILEPGQSTMYHSHEKAGYRDGIAWVYYVTYPENSGDTVLIVDALKRKLMHPIRPVVGNLVVFPTHVPHLVKRNVSTETRISISGNHYPDSEKLDEFFKEIYEGRSNYFYYVGAYNN